LRGLLTFTTLGPDTLKEVRSAFVHADGHTHTNRFVDMHDLGDMLIAAGFADPVMDMEQLTMTYAEPQSLLAELKAVWRGERDARAAARVDGKGALATHARCTRTNAARRPGSGNIRKYLWACVERRAAVHGGRTSHRQAALEAVMDDVASRPSADNGGAWFDLRQPC
jgi:hypothetical protein